MGFVADSGIGVYKLNSGSCKDLTSVVGRDKNGFRLGYLESRILLETVEQGLVRFSAFDLRSSIFITEKYEGQAKRRLHDAIQRLVRKGLVRKLARGFYELTLTHNEMLRILSLYVSKDLLEDLSRTSTCVESSGFEKSKALVLGYLENAILSHMMKNKITQQKLSVLAQTLNNWGEV